MSLSKEEYFNDKFEQGMTVGEIMEQYSKEQKHNMAACMLSILDSLKLYDLNLLKLEGETLSEMMFRKMAAYDINLNKELGFDHLKPVLKSKENG